MENKKELELDNEQSLLKFLQNPATKLVEFVTGLLSSERKDWILSSGKIIGSVIQLDLFKQLGKEIEQYRKKGALKENCFKTYKNRLSLHELLNFLETSVPDEELFVSIKSIFLFAISKNSTENDEMFAHEFIKTAKKLSGTEILILKANFQIAKGKQENEVLKRLEKTATNHSRAMWRSIIALQMHLEGFDSVIRKYEENLETLGLISPRNDDNRFSQDFVPTNKFRLTDVGYKFCEFITKHE